MRAKKSSIAGGNRVPQMAGKSTVGFATGPCLMRAGSTGLGLDAREGGRDSGEHHSPGAVDKSGFESGGMVKVTTKKRVSAGVKDVAVPKKPKAPSKKTKKDADAGAQVGQGVAAEEFRLPVTEKKPRKPRVKKDQDKTQPQIKKGRITKPGSREGMEKKAKTKKAIMVKSSAMLDADGPLPVEKELGLDEAMRRRIIWTPPKDTTPITVASKSGALPGLEPVETAQPAKHFGDLLSSFEYALPAQIISAQPVARKTDGAGLTKRRRIEVSHTFEDLHY